MLAQQPWFFLSRKPCKQALSIRSTQDYRSFRGFKVIHQILAAQALQPWDFLIRKPSKQACGLGIKKSCNCLRRLQDLVIATGFEPVTVCLEGRCSIQLSYATIPKRVYLLRAAKLVFYSLLLNTNEAKLNNTLYFSKFTSQAKPKYDLQIL
tara:strand:- start:459 stop:914 length:456 start_codon:yes stop_codon:yes gene_type:complete